jgi:hypothetical protein
MADCSRRGVAATIVTFDVINVRRYYPWRLHHLHAATPLRYSLATA